VAAKVRKQSLINTVLSSPNVIHQSNYRRRRRAKVGGPVISLDAGIIRQRSYTNVGSVVAFMIYAGIMVCYVICETACRPRRDMGTLHRTTDSMRLMELKKPPCWIL